MTRYDENKSAPIKGCTLYLGAFWQRAEAGEDVTQNLEQLEWIYEAMTNEELNKTLAISANPSIDSLIGGVIAPEWNLFGSLGISPMRFYIRGTVGLGVRIPICRALAIAAARVCTPNLK